MSEATANIDFNVNDRLPPIRAFLDRLDAIFQLPDAARGHIDLSKCQYLGPDAVTLLAAAILDGRRRGQRLRVSLPDGPAKLRSFCRWSGLEGLVTGEQGALPDEPSETVIRLRVLHGARWGDADPIIQLVNRHLEISSEPEEYLRICVNEVVQNIEDHADSPIGGVMCARYMSGDQQVRVAIVDRGVGIYTTLKQRYHDTTADNALRRVLRGKFTALSRPNNAGLGLCNLSNMVEYLKGDFVIISETAVAQGKAAKSRRFSALSRRFPGTAVFFTLPVGL